MKIKKIISARVYKRFKTMCVMFVGLFAINYISDLGVSEMLNTITEDTDLSDYGLFVNADEDYVQEEEERLMD